MEASLRIRLNDALKRAMKGQDKRATSTLRLILAAVKDRDIAARGKGNAEGLGEDEILAVLQTMIRQRHESIALYEKGGRKELADEEREEIRIIESFMPRQLTDEELLAAVRDAVAETGATGIKDMGKAMAALRERYAGRMDFAKASAAVRTALS